MTSAKLHIFFFVGLCIYSSSGLHSQAMHDDEAIIARVASLFEAMRKHDASYAKPIFMSEALFCTVSLKDGILKRDSTNLKEFLSSISKPSPKVWDERFEAREVKIMIDGPLAMAWVPYRFYVDTTFSHCGVDLFTLVKDGLAGWKISNVIDTRQTKDCTTYEQKQARAQKMIDQSLTEWHINAAKAQFDPYFDLMTEDGIFLGTDQTERWGKKQFMEFSAPFFKKGKAWSFSATERFIILDDHQRIAWFDETLDTWMGQCRGSGVFRKDSKEQWKLVHYNLTLLVPNEKMNDVIKAIGISKGK